MMKKIRIAEFKNSKYINISMLIIAGFTFILSILDFSVFFVNGQVGVRLKTIGFLSSALAIIPITWAACLLLTIKTKKNNFSRIPCYIMSALIGIAFILYYIVYGQEYQVRNILLFSVAVLAIYPFIIATLTLEGRLYNKVFSVIFSSILLVLSLVGAVVFFIYDASISLSFLIPALTYAELLLMLLNYDLLKPKKNNQTTATEITH